MQLLNLTNISIWVMIQRNIIRHHKNRNGIKARTMIGIKEIIIIIILHHIMTSIISTTINIIMKITGTIKGLTETWISRVTTIARVKPFSRIKPLLIANVSQVVIIDILILIIAIIQWTRTLRIRQIATILHSINPNKVRTTITTHKPIGSRTAVMNTITTCISHITPKEHIIREASSHMTRSQRTRGRITRSSIAHINNLTNSRVTTIGKQWRSMCNMVEYLSKSTIIMIMIINKHLNLIRKWINSQTRYTNQWPKTKTIDMFHKLGSHISHPLSQASSSESLAQWARSVTAKTQRRSLSITKVKVSRSNLLVLGKIGAQRNSCIRKNNHTLNNTKDSRIFKRRWHI